MIHTDRNLPVAATAPRGFTLVELLAALVLVAAILPVAMRGISMATTVAGLTGQRMTATTLAENAMADLLVTQGWRDGSLTGDFADVGHPEFTWRAEVADWHGIALQQLTVTVSWERRGHDRDVSLSTLVYQEEGQ